LQIILNGKTQELNQECTVYQLLEDKAMTLKAAAIELNGKILKQELWQSTVINTGDSLEILIFMGGG